MTPTPNPSPGADAKVAQRKAADTKASVWVGASAGIEITEKGNLVPFADHAAALFTDI